MWILLVVFVATVSVIIYGWNENRFGGVFQKRHFKPGMTVEIWYVRDNGFGVDESFMDASYVVLSVNIKENMLVVKRDYFGGGGWKKPVSFKWLFERACSENGFIILKDAEGNIVKKFD